jgi:aminopeptidase N
MREGLKSYFKKFAFKNTELLDFLKELGNAASALGIKENLVEWSYTWLKSSGVNIISYEYDTDHQGTITKFMIRQTEHYNGENRLRKQKFEIGFLNENMEVIDRVTVQTDDKVQEIFY